MPLGPAATPLLRLQDHTESQFQISEGSLRSYVSVKCAHPPLSRTSSRPAPPTPGSTKTPPSPPPPAPAHTAPRSEPTPQLILRQRSSALSTATLDPAPGAFLMPMDKPSHRSRTRSRFLGVVVRASREDRAAAELMDACSPQPLGFMVGKEAQRVVFRGHAVPRESPGPGSPTQRQRC